MRAMSLKSSFHLSDCAVVRKDILMALTDARAMSGYLCRSPSTICLALKIKVMLRELAHRASREDGIEIASMSIPIERDVTTTGRPTTADWSYGTGLTEPSFFLPHMRFSLHSCRAAIINSNSGTISGWIMGIWFEMLAYGKPIQSLWSKCSNKLSSDKFLDFLNGSA